MNIRKMEKRTRSYTHPAHQPAGFGCCQECGQFNKAARSDNSGGHVVQYRYCTMCGNAYKTSPVPSNQLED